MDVDLTPDRDGVHALRANPSRCGSTGCAAAAASSCTQRFDREGRDLAVAEYEPKMNVTPNAVALKGD